MPQLLGFINTTARLLFMSLVSLSDLVKLSPHNERWALELSLDNGHPYTQGKSRSRETKDSSYHSTNTGPTLFYFFVTDSQSFKYF